MLFSSALPGVGHGISNSTQKPSGNFTNFYIGD